MRLVQRIVPDSSTHQPRDTSIPLTLILHTNGASNSVGSLYEYIIRSKTRIYPHVQVAFDGSIEQYCPWDRQAYVQYDGNRYAFSAETQDSGYNNKPIDRDPWTDAQLHAFADLAISLGVEAKACTSPISGGIGFHSQFRAEWNKSGHNCPGSGRRDQIPQVIAYMTQVVIANDPPPTPTQEDDDMPAKLIRKTSTGSIEVYANGLAAPFHWADPNDAARNVATIGRLAKAGLVEATWVELDDDAFDAIPRLKV